MLQYLFLLPVSQENMNKQSKKKFNLKTITLIGGASTAKQTVFVPSFVFAHFLRECIENSSNKKSCSKTSTVPHSSFFWSFWICSWEEVRK